MSTDPILKQFRFTNAYRASDRVSQYLIREVIYDKSRNWADVFFRIILFKLFNRIETWVELENDVVEIELASFDVDRYADLLTSIRRRLGRLYSAAYIMPSARFFGSKIKHVNHMRLLRLMLESEIHEHLADAQSNLAAYEQLLAYPSIGPFLAYQFLTDLCYSEFLEFEESQFVVPGPGAIDGIYLCFSDLGDFSPADTIRWVMETQVEQFASRDLAFSDLWGRSLQLIDCQNLFCEVSKYARRAFPGSATKSGRTKIKQVFRPRPESVSAWYPPKWGINESVAEWLRTERNRTSALTR